MSSTPGTRRLLRVVEWLAALIGAVNCVLVPLLFAQTESDVFPLPGLYLIEITLLGLLVVVFVARRPRLDPRWYAIPWAGAGAILPFVFLGGFSIGFYLIPAVLAYILVGLLANLQLGRRLAGDLVVLVLAALVQGAVMALAILIA